MESVVIVRHWPTLVKNSDGSYSLLVNGREVNRGTLQELRDPYLEGVKSYGRNSRHSSRV